MANNKPSHTGADITLPKNRFISELQGAVKSELENSPRPVSKSTLNKLKALVKKADALPDEYFIEFGKVAETHAYIFKRMGYENVDDILKEPWLLKFYQWRNLASKAEGQRWNLGGKMLEKIVYNDPELHTALFNFAQRRLKALSDPRFFSELKFADNVTVKASEFKVIKTTQLVSGTKDYLDFAYFLYHEATEKAVVVIKGQIKREGAVGNYLEQARNDPKRLFTDGFSCFIEGKKVSFKPKDIIQDETIGSNVLVRSSSPIIIGSKSFTDVTPVFNSYTGVRKLANINETFHEFSTAPSTEMINLMLEDLFRAKTNAIKK
jgi:hypothetical protein